MPILLVGGWGMQLGKALCKGNGRAVHEFKRVYVRDDAKTGEYVYISPSQFYRFKNYAALAQHLEMTGTPSIDLNWLPLSGEE